MRVIYVFLEIYIEPVVKLYALFVLYIMWNLILSQTVSLNMEWTDLSRCLAKYYNILINITDLVIIKLMKGIPHSLF